MPEDRYRSSGMDRAPISWIVLSYHGLQGRPSPSGLASGRWHGCVRDNIKSIDFYDPGGLYIYINAILTLGLYNI